MTLKMRSIITGLAGLGLCFSIINCSGNPVGDPLKREDLKGSGGGGPHREITKLSLLDIKLPTEELRIALGEIEDGTYAVKSIATYSDQMKTDGIIAAHEHQLLTAGEPSAKDDHINAASDVADKINKELEKSNEVIAISRSLGLSVVLSKAAEKITFGPAHDYQAEVTSHQQNKWSLSEEPGTESLQIKDVISALNKSNSDINIYRKTMATPDGQSVALSGMISQDEKLLSFYLVKEYEDGRLQKARISYEKIADASEEIADGSEIAAPSIENTPAPAPPASDEELTANADAYNRALGEIESALEDLFMEVELETVAGGEGVASLFGSSQAGQAIETMERVNEELAKINALLDIIKNSEAIQSKLTEKQVAGIKIANPYESSLTPGIIPRDGLQPKLLLKLGMDEAAILDALEKNSNTAEVRETPQPVNGNDGVVDIAPTPEDLKIQSLLVTENLEKGFASIVFSAPRENLDSGFSHFYDVALCSGETCTDNIYRISELAILSQHPQHKRLLNGLAKNEGFPNSQNSPMESDSETGQILYVSVPFQVIQEKLFKGAEGKELEIRAKLTVVRNNLQAGQTGSESLSPQMSEKSVMIPLAEKKADTHHHHSGDSARDAGASMTGNAPIVEKLPAKKDPMSGLVAP